MALSSSSLTDIGQGKGKTTNFWVRYENSLADQTNVVNNANSLLSVIENEFNVTTGWFGTPTGTFGTSQRQEVRLDQADTANPDGSFGFPGASNNLLNAAQLAALQSERRCCTTSDWPPRTSTSAPITHLRGEVGPESSDRSPYRRGR
jgi:hypothetical protein